MTSSDPARARRASLQLAMCLLAIALLAACAPLTTAPQTTAPQTTAPQSPSPQTTAVVVRNETGAPWFLFEAVRDGWRAPRPVGSARVVRLHLPIGRYALGPTAERPLVAVPVLAAELGYEPTPLEVSLTAALPRGASPAGADWCWIPPGPFVLGDRLGVGQEDERPVRAPSSTGYWLAARETTNAQYAAFLNATPADQIDPGWLDFGGRKCRVTYDEAAGRYRTDAPQLPVVTVSAAGADAFCRWRTKATGAPHRLPSEAEWEKAARGPGSRVYAYGDTCATLRANQESGALAQVGRYAPNGFGLYDMTGNAFEWTQDVYVSGRDDDPDAGKFRALRGGSYLLDGIFCRNAMRMRLRPTVRADDVGFRVLREAR